MEKVKTPENYPVYNQGILIRDDELSRSQNKVPKLFKFFLRSYCSGPECQPTIVMALNLAQALARYTQTYDLGDLYKVEEMDNVVVMLYDDPGLIEWATKGKPEGKDPIMDDADD